MIYLRRRRLDRDPHAPPMAPACRRRVRTDRAGGLASRRGPARRRRATAADASLNPMAARPAHFPARAKRVIWIFINGGPSQVDTWEYKPALERWHGKSMREFDPSFKNTTGFFKNQVGGADEVAVPVHAAGRVRQDGLRDLPEPGPARRQDGVHPLGLHRVEQPFAGPVHDEHGHAAHGLPVRRLVGDLRPGQREPRTCPGSS